MSNIIKINDDRNLVAEQNDEIVRCTKRNCK